MERRNLEDLIQNYCQSSIYTSEIFMQIFLQVSYIWKYDHLKFLQVVLQRFFIDRMGFGIKNHFIIIIQFRCILYEMLYVHGASWCTVSKIYELIKMMNKQYCSYSNSRTCGIRISKTKLRTRVFCKNLIKPNNRTPDTPPNGSNRLYKFSDQNFCPCRLKTLVNEQLRW